MIRVTIYNEFVHEKTDEAVRSIYPEGIHMARKQHLEDEEIHIKTVTLDDLPEGLPHEVLEETHALIWWGHNAHHKVPDEVAVRVQQAVLRGMGMIVLHSGHHSKPFKLLMGTSCNLTWREDGDYELVWVCNPAHPIAQGVGRFIKLEEEETYGEPFGIPEPDELVFIGGYEGGEVFRSGCCYRKENGRVFYFQPGHETVPTYHHPEILKVIKNAIRWAKPIYRVKQLDCPHVTKPLGE